jgi:hypothetical protein
MNGCGCEPIKLGGRLHLGHEKKARNPHFSNYFSSSQCKEKLGKPLPPQYTLELLTVHAWEHGSGKSEFDTAQGFHAALKLVGDYRLLCIYWMKYYDFNDRIIFDYLTRQLRKPRYLYPHSFAPTSGCSCSTVEMRRWRLHIYRASPVSWHWVGPVLCYLIKTRTSSPKRGPVAILHRQGN